MILNHSISAVLGGASRRVYTAIVKQYRSNTVWATKRKTKTSTDVALEYFDTVYGSLFGKRWPSIRLALLSPHKYCAVVNNYCNPDEVCTQLENGGAINIREMLVVHKNSLLEQGKTMRRKKELDRIYYLDRKIEDVIARKREEEFGDIYPEKYINVVSGKLSNTKDDKLDKEEFIKQAKTPLEKSLAEASIDENRQIDPSEGLTSTRLNDFVPVSKLKGKEGFISEAEHFSFFTDTSEFPITVEPQESLHFPSHLQIYTYSKGDLSDFRPAKSGVNGLTDYYLMDASSVLPVLALDLRPGDTVLDMCAAPGGKSLLCLQTLYPDSLLCNDSSLSRLNRLRRVMTQYVEDWEEKVTISNELGTLIQDEEMYSKILVDVPCTTDRVSVTEDDNNIFKPSRNKERILLPQMQVELLFHALKLVKEGGSVVYSTCSLNPAQNDGVVQMALRRVWQETSMKIVVKELTEALEPAKVVFQFASPNCVSYGSLVVPYLPSNFGPMYFCKFEKKEA